MLSKQQLTDVDAPDNITRQLVPLHRVWTERDAVRQDAVPQILEEVGRVSHEVQQAVS
jgi:hypothetical protein